MSNGRWERLEGIIWRGEKEGGGKRAKSKLAGAEKASSEA